MSLNASIIEQRIGKLVDDHRDTLGPGDDDGLRSRAFVWLATSIVTVEAYLDRGIQRDAHDPHVIRRVPTYEGMLGFLEAYDRARPVPLTRAQHRGARAWAAYWTAYGAWISIAPGDTDWPEDSWPALLRDAGERLLA